eukprot:scaffold322461_cov39-Tisochrysis_lutea.AAC.4
MSLITISRGWQSGYGQIVITIRFERALSVILEATVLVALGLGLAQQLTGTEAILYYTPRILNQCVDPEERAAVGISQEEVENCVSVDVVFLVSLGVGVSKLIGEFVAAAVSASLWLACHLYT